MPKEYSEETVNFGVYKITDVFTKEELETLRNAVTGDPELDSAYHLGRIQIQFGIPRVLIEKLETLAQNLYGKEFNIMGGGAYVEYNNKYGEPNLPPHFDGDNSDLIIDFQLDSNASWALGVNMEAHELEDNSAIFFNPNLNIHWRPIKQFKDGEYIRLMFFRGFIRGQRNDYSDRILSQDHPVFREVVEFRNSLQ